MPSRPSRAAARHEVRFVSETLLLTRAGSQWFSGRERTTGADVLGIEVELDAEARQRLALASDVLGAWPAFAMPLGDERTPRGTTLIAYPERAATRGDVANAAFLGEDDARAVTIEVLELLDAAHARGIVHPGIDPLALAVGFDTKELRPRARLRGLGLPSGARTAADDLLDLARCVTRLYVAAAPAASRSAETCLGSVLARALGQPELRFASARAMRDALVPPRRGRRVLQTTSMLKATRREDNSHEPTLRIASGLFVDFCFISAGCRI